MLAQVGRPDVKAQAMLTVTPALVSITVTPVNPTLTLGASPPLPFAAVGNYSDNSTQDLTGAATWVSSKTTVATIDATGVATAVGTGKTSITAKVGGVTGQTTLTVQ